MIGLSMTAYPGRNLDGLGEWLEKAEELGFEFIELVSEWPHFVTCDNWRGYRELLESHSLGITLHAPFSDLNIGSLNERIRRASIEVLGETLEIASALDVLAVTVHPGHCSPVSRRYRMDYNLVHRASLMELEKLAEEHGVPVGVENMPNFPILDAQTPERLAELLKGINLGVTFDVGHLNTTTRDFEGFLQIFQGRIVSVHLHDNSGESDEHLPPGDGTVPWKRVLLGLPDVPRVLEVSSLSDAVRGLSYLRDIGGL
ncbi:sugar phosphate isomerase/epimerase family protein [Thermococcus sp.]